MIGYIYLIKSLNLYKIGKTKNQTEKRLSHYKTHNPHGIELIYSFRIKNYSLLEKQLLKKFKDKKVTGEWFELDNKDIALFLDMVEPFMTRIIEKYEQFNRVD